MFSWRLSSKRRRLFSLKRSAGGSVSNNCKLLKEMQGESVMHDERKLFDWRKYLPSEPLQELDRTPLVTAEDLRLESHRETTKTYPGYTPQYAYLYRVRLQQLEASLKAGEVSGDPIVELSKMKANVKCQVIGCLFRSSKARKSYVKAIEEGDTLKEYIDFDEVPPMADDEYYIENGTGRRLLNLAEAELVLPGGKRVSAGGHTLIPGCIVRLRCELLSENEVKVTEVHLPGIIPRPLMVEDPGEITLTDGPTDTAELFRRAKSGKKLNLFLMASGLELDHDEAGADLLRDFLLGQTASGPLVTILEAIQGSIFLGGFIGGDKKLNKQLLRGYEFKDKQQTLVEKTTKALKAADSLLYALGTRFPVVVIPSPSDPSDSEVPQRALPSFCFPRTKTSEKLTSLGNPANFMFGKTQIQVTDGSNIQTLLKLCPGITDEVFALEQLIAARHFAPNCPESSACFPAKSKDPLVMEKPCDLFVCGGAQKHNARTITGPPHPIRLLAVPNFCSTRTAILVDIDTFESFELNFPN